MAATYLGHFKDSYSGTGSGTIRATFHSPYSLSTSIYQLGAVGSNYVMQYHVYGQMYTSTAYSCTFSLKHGFKFNPAVSSSISTTGNARDVSYDLSGIITGVYMDVDGSAPGYPRVNIVTTSYTWAYSIFVEEYLTLFDGV